MFGISRKTGVAVLGAFGAVALGAGVATAVTAASIPSSDGTITGCYVTASNSLKSFYLIDKQSGAHCPPGFTEISFNQHGQPGQPGPSGPSGPAGASGAPGASGSPGPADAFSTGVGLGGRLNASGFVTFQTLSVPAGKYAITATFDINNATLNPTGVDCQLEDTNGEIGLVQTYASSGPRIAVAVQGTRSTPAAADTINLQCQAAVPGQNLIVENTSIDAIAVASINGS